MRHLAFRTTSSIWFEKTLELPDDLLVPEIDVSADFLIEDKAKLINWLREHQVRFPWIYLQKEIKMAQSEKHIFVIILHSDTIIGYLKIGINKTYIHDFDKVIHFPKNSAFIYDTFVLPEYRGKHVALYALTKTILFLREKYFDKLWCHIEHWNHASLKIFRKAGFKKRGHIRFCRLLGFPLFIKNGHTPLINLESFIHASDCKK